jgi:hypothetical protein
MLSWAAECDATAGDRTMNACILDLWLIVSTPVSKTVLSFWSPHLLPKLE